MLHSVSRSSYNLSSCLPHPPSSDSQDLLRAADQYIIEGLKSLCESAIAQDLTVENVSETFKLAEDFHAPQLMNLCVQYALEHYNLIVQAHDADYFTDLMDRMKPRLKEILIKLGSKSPVKVIESID